MIKTTIDQTLFKLICNNIQPTNYASQRNKMGKYFQSVIVRARSYFECIVVVSSDCFFCTWMNLIMKKNQHYYYSWRVQFGLSCETKHCIHLRASNWNIELNISHCLLASTYVYSDIQYSVSSIQYPVMLSFFPHLISNSLFAFISKSTRMYVRNIFVYTIRLSITLYYVCLMFVHQRM